MTDTIVVTGGAGYIGSHVCKALAQAGFRPVVYDNLSGGHRHMVRWGPLAMGDIRDPASLSNCFNRYKPAAVIHLAGLIAAGESVKKPSKYYDNNVRGTLTLFDTMLHHGIDRIVFSSSAAVYGDPDSTPIPEHHPIRPVNPYGHTKAMCEQLLFDYTVYGLRSISLRYFNAAGADPDGELGESHEPETHLIPLVLQAAAGLRSHIDIFGDQYPTPDGTCIRDYIHVSDLAAAHVASLSIMDDRPSARAFNLGNGMGYSVLDVVRAAERVTERRIPTRRCPARPGDPPVLVADSAHATNALKWHQIHPDIDTQIAHAWRWLKADNVRVNTSHRLKKPSLLATD
ncbi:MAG: UDP-glucose 4-epimerase GalE [Rhodospirillales bacterium]